MAAHTRKRYLRNCCGVFNEDEEPPLPGPEVLHRQGRIDVQQLRYDRHSYYEWSCYCLEEAMTNIKSAMLGDAFEPS